MLAAGRCRRLCDAWRRRRLLRRSAVAHGGGAGVEFPVRHGRTGRAAGGADSGGAARGRGGGGVSGAGLVYAAAGARVERLAGGAAVAAGERVAGPQRSGRARRQRRRRATAPPAAPVVARGKGARLARRVLLAFRRGAAQAT
eukprot:165884-Chlamydomonas_euryale.AAC.3